MSHSGAEGVTYLLLQVKFLLIYAKLHFTLAKNIYSPRWYFYTEIRSIKGLIRMNRRRKKKQQVDHVRIDETKVRCYRLEAAV